MATCSLCPFTTGKFDIQQTILAREGGKVQACVSFHIRTEQSFVWYRPCCHLHKRCWAPKRGKCTLVKFKCDVCKQGPQRRQHFEDLNRKKCCGDSGNPRKRCFDIRRQFLVHMSSCHGDILRVQDNWAPCELWVSRAC